ncbi:yurt [Carabus blaptoides fortunei]
MDDVIELSISKGSLGGLIRDFPSPRGCITRVCTLCLGVSRTNMIQGGGGGTRSAPCSSTTSFTSLVAYVSLAEVLAARPQGISEMETWALLCQAVQTLQDLFLSDGVSGGRFVPVVTPATLLLSSRGRVTLSLSRITPRTAPGYVAPEYQPQQQESTTAIYTDTDIEKMLVFSLGECLKRAALTSHTVTIQLSTELCKVLTAMGRQLAAERASLMHLLDVISEYSRRREQSKPFSHIVMDLYRETIIYRNSKPVLPDCALQPHLKQHMVQPCSDRNELLSRRVETIDNCKTISSNWKNLNDEHHLDYPRLNRNIFNSLEHINKIPDIQSVTKRPKSICTNEELFLEPATKTIHPRKKYNMKRNPVKRAASRLYHVADDASRPGVNQRNCIGPEFVIRASLPSKQLVLDDTKFGNLKTLTVIMLNGVKLEITCKPEMTTAGQLFEKIIHYEDIEENYFLGLSVLISGDFVFLPSDSKLSKILTADRGSDARLTLFVRVRFFLPSLRGIRSQQSRHLLYLQMRRSLLENQLPCTADQLCELGSLALQAEFGDYSQKHESNHYFLLEHYIPELLIEKVDPVEFRRILTNAHAQRRGLSVEKAEEDFITLAQTLPYYGVHFYSATLMAKSVQRDVWLCVSAQGISLFERHGTAVFSTKSMVCEIFKWQTIQTLCYSKHYLCILPHCTPARKALPRKYKLKMDHKKSYYTFRLASLHHQFFLRLRTEYSSLQSLSQQFGVLLKDIKNETNTLFKMSSHNSDEMPIIKPHENNQFENRTAKCKRSKSVHELSYINIPLEEYQNKENENPREQKQCMKNAVENPGLTNTPCPGVWDKRKGVKMGTRAFTSTGQRMSRSLEAVNAWPSEEQDKISLHSSSRMSTTSSGVPQNADVYVLNSSIKSLDDQFLPDFQESLSQSLLDKLKNLSFADERILKSITIHRDVQGSLGIQVTEGSDGKVYIQSVVVGGAASNTGNVFKGDQIVAVNGQNLLNLKYSDALLVLKNTEHRIELVLSQISHSQYMPTPKRTNIAKQFAERSSKCLDDRNGYEFYTSLFKCDNKDDKLGAKLCECRSPRSNQESELRHQYPDICATSRVCSDRMSRCTACLANIDDQFDKQCQTGTSDHKVLTVSHVPLPRSLGLGRRWRGPVRYPVTPIKNPTPQQEQHSNSVDLSHFLNTSDEEQIFI